MATQRLVIIGAGGFGREVVDIIEAINDETPGSPTFELLGFLDDGQPESALLDSIGVAHLGPVSHLASMPRNVGYVIGVGAPHVRRKLDEQGGGRACPVLVHPRAVVGRHDVTMGEGTIICAGALITTNIHLGRHVHVNLGCTIGHDATLNDYVTLSPTVSISGNVVAESESFFGTGAKVNPRLRVGASAIVGTGAAVIRDVAAGTTVVGVPAKARQA